jgi:hypothetical protein
VVAGQKLQLFGLTGRVTPGIQTRDGLCQSAHLFRAVVLLADVLTVPLKKQDVLTVFKSSCFQC